MREFTFSDEDLKAIDTDRYQHPHPHVQRKMEVLWLKSHALPHQQIANLSGVSLRTVQRYLDEYLEGGLKQARRCKWRGQETAWLRHEQSIQEYFWDHPPRSTKEAAKVIYYQTGVRRGLTQVRAFLKAHLGLRYRKVAAIPVPPKMTIEEHAQEQSRFLGLVWDLRKPSEKALKHNLIVLAKPEESGQESSVPAEPPDNAPPKGGVPNRVPAEGCGPSAAPLAPSSSPGHGLEKPDANEFASSSVSGGSPSPASK